MSARGYFEWPFRLMHSFSQHSRDSLHFFVFLNDSFALLAKSHLLIANLYFPFCVILLNYSPFSRGKELCVFRSIFQILHEVYFLLSRDP